MGDHMALTTYATHLDAMADEVERVRNLNHLANAELDKLRKNGNHWLVEQAHLEGVADSLRRRCDTATDLVGRLADGIGFWADQEDGVPEELFSAYQEALKLTGKGYETP